MNRRFKIYPVIIVVFCLCLSAKPDENINTSIIFKTAYMRLDRNKHVPLEIRLSEKQKISVPLFFQLYKSYFQLSADITFKCAKVVRDHLGQSHHRIRQYYKGIEVAEIQYLLHERFGSVFYAHGRFIHDLDLDVVPGITESHALQIALDHVGAESYYWENETNRNPETITLNKQPEKCGPKGELKISAGNGERSAENFRLVYRFDIFSKKPFNRSFVDIDAKTGEVVGTLPRIYYDDVQGQGTSLYHGVVPITVSQIESQIISSRWHLTEWYAYFGTGESWWLADPELGDVGGYGNNEYIVLDTEPVTLTGSDLCLSFFHRLSTVYGDGCNVRISGDGGKTWEVLLNPSRSYDGFINGFRNFGEGHDIPGWGWQMTELNRWWTYIQFDLSQYKEKTVNIRFAFASDSYGSTAEGYPDRFGWQIDQIMISNETETLFRNSGQAEGMTASVFQSPDSTLVGKYRLREYERGNGIITLDAGLKTDMYQSVDIIDDDANFTDEKAGVSAHWAAEFTYDYFLKTFGRNSYDNNGGLITSFVHWDLSTTAGYAASYSGEGQMKFNDRDSSGNASFVKPDVIGHEFTHGVIQKSANLVYRDDSGALNESFADIFGILVLYHIEGVHSQKLTGRTPDTYLGEDWYEGSEDHGGIHHNCSVQNLWFYLLAEGGTGINDHGYAYSVDGIWVKQAEQIVYRNLTIYLMPYSYHYDARLGSINAAIDLFGNNSPQYNSVIDAWDAVGVMPVVLKSFEISENKYGVTIAWQTASETDCDYWIIERKDIEMKTDKFFTCIAEIESRGDRYNGDEYEYVDTEVPEGHRYVYRLGHMLQKNEIAYFDEKEIFAGTPDVFKLHQNYPNPFNSETFITYDLPQITFVKIEVFDILGRRVITLAEESRKEGTYKILWNGRDSNGDALASGIYYYKIEAGGFHDVKKMVIVK
jgi:Zn-dependent metalloprotease